MADNAQRVLRHAALDRIGHWLFAVSMFTLLGTGFLPVLGVNFEWVTWHWSTGLVLLVLLGLHIWRSWLKTRLKQIWFGLNDLKLGIAGLSDPAAKPGKYSPAQKLMHLGVTVLTLATLLTGLIMMAKVDTPLWERDPYLLDAGTWGIIYVIHGLAAMMLVTTVLLHIYFALRPEKRLYLKSILGGYLTREEFEAHHDATQWQGDRAE